MPVVGCLQLGNAMCIIHNIIHIYAYVIVTRISLCYNIYVVEVYVHAGFVVHSRFFIFNPLKDGARVRNVD